MVATIATSMICMSLPYEPGLNAKHLAWMGRFENNTFLCYCRWFESRFYGSYCKRRAVVTI